MVVQAIKEKDHEKAEYLASRIHSSAERFSAMIASLSDFTLLDDDKQAPELTNLNAPLAVATQLLRFDILDKEASIVSEKLPSIRVYPAQIEQLFYHLLHNAIKFSKKDEKPVVSISCSMIDSSEFAGQTGTGQQYVKILIEDNGIGIDSSQLEKVFDMFSQLPVKPGRTGEGVGLTFCRKIIRNHNGFIKAQSEINRGTRISIILPAS